MYKITDRKGLRGSDWFAHVLKTEWQQVGAPTGGISFCEFSPVAGHDFQAVAATINSCFEECREEFDSKRHNSDGAMAEGVHRALAGLTRREASNPEFWAYMTCVGCIKYVKWRWSAESEAAFFDHCAGPVRRNALARLWWWAEITHQPDVVENVYEVTRSVQGRQNLMLWFVDCAFSGNKKVALALNRIQKERALEKDDQVRICRNINRIAKTVCIDALNGNSLKAVCERALLMP